MHLVTVEGRGAAVCLDWLKGEENKERNKNRERHSKQHHDKC